MGWQLVIGKLSSRVKGFLRGRKTAVSPPIFCLFLLVACSSPIEPEEAPAASEAQTGYQTQDGEQPVDQLSNFSALVEQTRIENGIPGVGVALVQGSEIIFAEGFGERELGGGESVTHETLFHIGSTHKSITAMLIATLVDDDLLGWDTPIVELYPDFELATPDATQQVTIRHLLSMSSGIPAEAEDEFGDEIETAEDIFALLPQMALASQPGTEFSYSNISTSIAGYVGVIAADEGTNQLYNGYDQLLQERIFGPIGMETATMAVEEAWANPNHSASHIFTANDEVIVAESYDFTGDPLAPSGAIKASVMDMARYLSTQLERGIAPDGTQVVSEANLVETWQPQIEDSESGEQYGLGWGMVQQNGFDIILHDGSYDNFSSLLIFLPEVDMGMVLLTNIDDPGDFLEDVSEAFIELAIE